jgi:chitinase
MRIVFAIALTSAALCTSARADETVFASSFEPAWVLGYHVGYQSGMYPTNKIDFGALSHIVIGPVVPIADGSLDTTFDIDAVNGPAWATAVAAAAHTANRKALLMIGGAGAITAWQGAASGAHRATFVTNLLNEMDAIGVDGLDLDWEPLDVFDSSGTDYADFAALAQALRTARPSMVLTVPVGPINVNYFPGSDPFFGSVAPLFDRIDIMTYDMEWDAGGWDSWFSSALHGESGTTPTSVDSSVAYYLASGVPRSKLGIGTGFYGACWQGVTGPRQNIGAGAGIIGSDNTYSYHTIVTQYYSAGNYHYDVTADAPWLGSATPFGPNGCNFLSYENAASVAAKGAYATRNGLGGAIIWTIGEGYVPENVGQENALLEALSAAFHPTP